MNRPRSTKIGLTKKRKQVSYMIGKRFLNIIQEMIYGWLSTIMFMTLLIFQKPTQEVLFYFFTNIGKAVLLKVAGKDGTK